MSLDASKDMYNLSTSTNIFKLLPNISYFKIYILSYYDETQIEFVLSQLKDYNIKHFYADVK